MHSLWQHLGLLSYWSVNIALNLNDISNEANIMCNPSSDMEQREGNMSNRVKYSQSHN